ncbi:MAG: hypothetical protein ACJAYU_004110, partial [Bradymonadia bacterium]
MRSISNVLYPFAAAAVLLAAGCGAETDPSDTAPDFGTAPDAESDGVTVDAENDAGDPGGDAEADAVEGCVDRDRDGFGEGCSAGPDCNDENPEVSPGRAEVCGDGFDNNCDLNADEGCPCTDGASRTCYDGPDEAE